MSDSTLYELFNALTADMAPEDILSSGIEGLIAADITIQRQKKGLSQTQLAEILGVTQAQVSKWERGDTNYKIDTLCRIAIALDMEIHSPFERSKSVGPADEASYRSRVFVSTMAPAYQTVTSPAAKSWMTTNQCWR